MHTLVINYGNLNIGGIEKYLFELSKYLTDNGDRVIWLRDPVLKIADSYRDLFLGNAVERVVTDTSKFNWFDHDELLFSKEEDIVVLSFDPMSMARALQLALEYREFHITPYYVVPNTTGNLYYLERYFNGKKRKRIQRKLAGFLSRWEHMGLVRFFNKLQIQSLENNYEIKITQGESKILRGVYGITDLNQDNLSKRSKRVDFTIGTLGRFDYPHKGYMLGLVRAYGRLKEKYPDIRLKIGGYGPGETLLKKEIEKLPLSFQEDIKLTGPVSPKEMDQFYSEVHLNISVAGAVWEGVKRGVLSIPARNYCEGACEVYGFLPDSGSKTTSLETGEPVEPYIEHVLTCSEDEYIRLSKEAYDDYRKLSKPWPMYFFDTKPSSEVEIDFEEIRYMKKLMRDVRVKQYFEAARNKVRYLRR